MGTHLRVLSEIYSMNTNMTGLDGFQKKLHSSALDESSVSIVRVNPFMPGDICTIVVWTCDIFEDNFGIWHKFTKYFKESCLFNSVTHFFLKLLSKTALVIKILQ